MSLLRQLSVLAVCQVLGDRADSLLGFVGERFNDHGARLETALGKSSERAWECLEVALDGESRWTFVSTAKDEQTLQRQIRSFLASVPEDELPGDAASFRKKASAELKAARKAKLVPGGGVSATDIAGDHARMFGRYGDPQGIIERDRQLLDGVSGELDKAGYPTLARYVGLRPAGGQPLLVQAVRYFFRREVESDQRLATGLTMEKLDGLDAGLRTGFEDLHSVLENHGEKLRAMLASTHAGVAEVSAKVSATMEEVTGARDDIQSLRALMEERERFFAQRMEALQSLLEKAVLAPPARVAPAAPAAPVAQVAAPRDEEVKVPTPMATPAGKDSAGGFFALASGLDQHGSDWSKVRQLLAQVQRVSPEEQRRRPELARAFEEVTEMARLVETTRRTILHLEQAKAGRDPIPVLPDDSPIFDAIPVDEEPPKPKKRASGRLISPIFQKAWQQQAEASGSETPASEEKPPVAPNARNRLLSPLFEKKPPGDAGKK